MPNHRTTKAARDAARAAVTAAQEEAARRTRLLAEDLTIYFAARDRMEAIDRTLEDRIRKLRDQAAERRDHERSKCATSLHAIRDRGEGLTEIAKLAGISQREVRDLIELAESGEEPVPTADGQAAVKTKPGSLEETTTNRAAPVERASSANESIGDLVRG